MKKSKKIRFEYDEEDGSFFYNEIERNTNEQGDTYERNAIAKKMHIKSVLSYTEEGKEYETEELQEVETEELREIETTQIDENGKPKKVKGIQKVKILTKKPVTVKKRGKTRQQAYDELIQELDESMPDDVMGFNPKKLIKAKWDEIINKKRGV